MAQVVIQTDGRVHQVLDDGHHLPDSIVSGPRWRDPPSSGDHWILDVPGSRQDWLFLKALGWDPDLGTLVQPVQRWWVELNEDSWKTLKRVGRLTMTSAHLATVCAWGVDE